MKVLLLFAGIPHYTTKLLEKIVQRGVDIVVILPEVKSTVIGAGVKLNESATSYRILRTIEKRAWYKKSYFPDLKDILSQEKPDILVVGWPYFLQFFFDKSLFTLLKTLKIHFVIREIPFQIPPYRQFFSYFKIHSAYDEQMNKLNGGIGFYIRNRFLMGIRKVLYKRVSATLNYSTCAYDILPSYGVPKEKIHVTYNATDAEAIWKALDEIKDMPSLLPVNKHRIIHIGRLVKWKRVDLLIQSFNKLVKKYPDAELLIIGDGPELENLKEMVRTFNIGNRVTFTGAIYDSLQLTRYMYESSAYVLAGMGGLSINDAMACSLPVICSVCDGTEKDLVVDGYNGFFFREGDAVDLYEKLDCLFSSDENILKFGEASRKIIESKVNLDVVADRFVKAFEYCIHNELN